VYDCIIYILYYNFLLGVSVQKTKALTVKDTVTLVKVGGIWCALCIKCRKLIAEYLSLQTFIFGGSS